MQVFFQLCYHPFLFGNITDDMQLVVLSLKTKLFPDVEYKIDGIMGMTCLEAIAELESVLLETEHVKVFIVETAV